MKDTQDDVDEHRTNQAYFCKIEKAKAQLRGTVRNEYGMTSHGRTQSTLHPSMAQTGDSMKAIPQKIPQKGLASKKSHKAFATGDRFFNSRRGGTNSQKNIST